MTTVDHYPLPSRMVSILSSLFGQTKLYEPSPRFFHGAAAVRGRCYLRGGCVQDLSASGRRKLPSTIEIFDPHLETWEEHPTTGVPPPGLYSGACTSLLVLVWWMGWQLFLQFPSQTRHHHTEVERATTSEPG